MTPDSLTAHLIIGLILAALPLWLAWQNAGK